MDIKHETGASPLASYVEVLEICRRYFQATLHLRHPSEHLCVVLFISHVRKAFLSFIFLVRHRLFRCSTIYIRGQPVVINFTSFMSLLYFLA